MRLNTLLLLLPLLQLLAPSSLSHSRADFLLTKCSRFEVGMGAVLKGVASRRADVSFVVEGSGCRSVAWRERAAAA